MRRITVGFRLAGACSSDARSCTAITLFPGGNDSAVGGVMRDAIPELLALAQFCHDMGRLNPAGPRISLRW